MYLVFKNDSCEAQNPWSIPVVVTLAVPDTTITEIPVDFNVTFALCSYPTPLSSTSTAVTIPLAAFASALITALSPIGLVLESS